MRSRAGYLDRLFRRLRLLERIGAVLPAAERDSIGGLWRRCIVSNRACHDLADLHVKPSGARTVFRRAANAQGRNIAFNIGEVNVTYVGAPFLQFGLPIRLQGFCACAVAHAPINVMNDRGHI